MSFTQYDGTPIAEGSEAATGLPTDFSIPGAHEDPDLWDSVRITSADGQTEFLLPPPGMGRVEVKFPWKARLDAKGGAGKAKPRVTRTGGEPVKGSIKIIACAEAWPSILAAATEVFPGSGPWKIGHPKASLSDCTQAQVEEWKDAPDFGKDGHGEITWEFDVKEVKPQAQAGKGGGSATKTFGAADAQRITAKRNPGDLPAKGNPNQGFDEVQKGAAKP